MNPDELPPDQSGSGPLPDPEKKHSAETPHPAPHKANWLLRIALLLAALALLITAAAIIVLRSERFHAYIRTRIIQEAERATGGRVEIGEFQFDWTGMQASVDRFVLHGTETGDQEPLVRIGSATLGFRIISVLEKSVDLASLRIEDPQVHVILYADGSNNFPGPPSRGNRLWSEELLNLKVGQYEINNGQIVYDNRQTPFALRGENLRIRMSYEALTPSYNGEITSGGVRLNIPEIAGAAAQSVSTTLKTDFKLERDRVSFQRMQLETDGGSTIQLAGILDNLRAPRGTLTMQVNASMQEAKERFKLPLEPVGSATLTGQVRVDAADAASFAIDGRLVAAGLRYSQGRVQIADARVEGEAQITREGFWLRSMTSRLLGATITGETRLEHWNVLHVAGQIAGLDVRRAVSLVTPQAVPWNGLLAGKFSLDTSLNRADAIARANLTISPIVDVPSNPADPALAVAANVHPIRGQVDMVYDQTAGTVALGASSLETGMTQVEVSGTLGRELRVHLQSTNLDDVQPVLTMLGENTNAVSLPVHLNNGSVTVDGTVQGTLDSLRFAGQAAVANGEFRGYSLDRFTADINVDRNNIVARNITSQRGATTVTGSASLTAQPPPGVQPAGVASGFENAGITAQLNVREIRIAEWIQEIAKAGSTSPPPQLNVSGVASADVRVSGSIQNPEFALGLDVVRPIAFGETFDRLRANVHYLPGVLEITDGLATDAGSEVRFSGHYQHSAGAFKTGDISFDAVTENLPSARLEHMAGWKMPVSSVFNGRMRAAGKMTDGVFNLSSATVDVSARNITVDQQPIGDFTILAETQGTTLTVTAGGNVRESLVEASGTWRLQGEAPGSGTVQFSRLSAASARSLAMLGVAKDQVVRELPVEGFVEGGASISVPLQDLSAFRAQLTLTAMQVNSKPGQQLSFNLQPDDMMLRNTQPVVLDITVNEARVQSAHFTGRDTDLTVAGVIPFREGTGADLNLRGNINLIILQLLYADLAAQGNATVDASIRGNLQDPVINGRLTFAKTRLELKDFPNGVDEAEGAILFDRRRATIERLTAQTGGGTLALSGFLEFGSTVVYRVQANLHQVRVLYPQDVSSTFSGSLAFNGTPAASTLTGTLTLNRVRFTPRADLGDLAAQLSQSVPGTDSTSTYLNGLQMDLRIENDPGFQLETSLTRNLEAEVSLRLRGTPVRPVLLGSISVDHGEVQVFGNRYTVERGEIRFLNPVKIEPTFDMNLSTRARGVTVNVSFSGTMAHLNPNYSSDPPLQSSEIFALLAVGRDPTQSSSQVAPGIPGTGASNFAQTGGSILGQALSAQVSNRVQKFFGTTHVKIDPTLTGVDNLPQARLTLEQQVSKDITLTYITNLNKSTEQIVRVQWDLSREWSAIAVRDQNGLFGVDFQFRKRFN